MIYSWSFCDYFKNLNDNILSDRSLITFALGLINQKVYSRVVAGSMIFHDVNTDINSMVFCICH